MKKLLFLIFLTTILTTSLGAASSENSPVIDVLMMRQDPYPAVPGQKVTLLFKIENSGWVDAANFTMNLTPSSLLYLFSEGDKTRNLGIIRSTEYGKAAFLVEYELGVSHLATDDEAQFEVKYTFNTGKIHTVKEMNVTIEDPTTDFHLMTEQISEHMARLVMTNIGDKDAKAVNLVMNGTHKYQIGNIIVGNYTSKTIYFPGEGDVEFELQYTDTANTRRILHKTVNFYSHDLEDVDIFSQSSGSSTTVYVVNIGSYPIYSVVVNMPNQPAISVSGSSKSVIGNLDAGDYSTASFTITSAAIANTTHPLPNGTTQRNFSGSTEDRAAMRQRFLEQMDTGSVPDLSSFGRTGGFLPNAIQIEVSYTDYAGNRYTVRKTLQQNSATSSAASVTGQATRTTSNFASSSSFQMNYIYIGGGGIAGVILIFWAIKKRREHNSKK